MSSIRRLFVLSALLGACQWMQAADKLFGQDLIDVKLSLPNGDTYRRGESDPVHDLMATIVLTNRTTKENLTKESLTIQDAERLNGDDYIKLHSMTLEQQQALLDKKKVTRQIEGYPINKDSLGFAFVDPQLGPHDFVDVVITKQPEEGQPAPEKPVVVPRDNKPDQARLINLEPTRYVAAGTSTEPIPLPVGKYYQITDPGTYKIKVILRNIADNDKSQKYAESDELTFHVLPFKVMSQKIEVVKRDWAEYERGDPKFDYMIYQVKTSGAFDDIYVVQRIPVRKFDTWEWTRVCSVKDGTIAQVAQLSPTKVKLAAVQAKGDFGIYELDFSKPGVKITGDVKDLKGDTIPKMNPNDGTLTE